MPISRESALGGEEKASFIHFSLKIKKSREKKWGEIFETPINFDWQWSQLQITLYKTNTAQLIIFLLAVTYNFESITSFAKWIRIKKIIWIIKPLFRLGIKLSYHEISWHVSVLQIIYFPLALPLASNWSSSRPTKPHDILLNLIQWFDKYYD